MRRRTHANGRTGPNRRRVLKGVVGAAAATVAVSGRAAADSTTIRVGDDGDYESIQAGIDAASPGDTVAIGPGSYAESVVVRTADLTIVGDPGSEDEAGSGPEAPTITVGRGYTDRPIGFELQNVTGVTIAGVRIEAVDDDTIGIRGGVGDITVRDTTIANTANAAIAWAGLGHRVREDLTVVRNRIVEADGDAIRLDNVTDSTIADNVIEAGPDATRGIRLHTNLGEPDGSQGALLDRIDSTDLAVTDNQLTGPFEGGAINLLAINRIDPDAASDTEAAVQGLQVRDNTIQAAGGDGVLCTTNSERGAAVTVDGVTVTGNRIEGARRGVFVADDPAAASSFANLTVAENDVTASMVARAAGVDGVAIRSNTVVGEPYLDGQLFNAIDVRTSGGDTVKDVTIEDNAIEGHCQRGIDLSAEDGDIEEANVVDNTLDLTDAAHGIHVIANGREGTDSKLSETAVAGNDIGGDIEFNCVLVEAIDRDALLEGVTVTDNTISPAPEELPTTGGITVWGHGFADDGDGMRATARDVTVRGNDLRGRSRGIEVRTTDANAVVENVSVAENDLTENGVACVLTALEATAMTDVAVTGNEVSENVTGIGCRFATSDVEDVRIDDNTVADNTEQGVLVTPDTDPTPITVERNNISGNDVGVVNAGDEPLDATRNYWGHPTGPDHEDNPRGNPKGDIVIGAVEYSPWSVQRIEDGDGNFVGGRGGGN